MIENCPHCNESLNLTGAKKSKVQAALDKLPPGHLLKLACPHCKSQFELKPNGTVPGMEQPKKEEGAPAHTEKPKVRGAKKADVTPPPPPDLSWLSSGQMQDKEVIEDTPMALILMKGSGITEVREAFEDEGFLPTMADSVNDALDKMQFTPYAAVVLKTDFENTPLAQNPFHVFMMKMAMIRRRNLHYTLIGPEFQTLYDLQALSNSANLVINESDLNNFKLILKKSLHETQKLFGPLADAMVREGRITSSIWLDIKVKAEQKMKSAVLKDLLEVKG